MVVPVYNNADSLRALHERLGPVLRSLCSSHEVIYVNDGSSDGSYRVLRDLYASDRHVKVLDLDGNFGQSAALLAGMRETSGQIVVTMDADLQNHPEDIPGLVGRIREGADLACGVRLGRKDALVTRRGPSGLANLLVTAVTGVDLPDWGCGLNAAKAALVQELLARDPLPRFPKIEAAMAATNVVAVPVGHSARAHGVSGYGVRGLCRFAADFLRDFHSRRNLKQVPGKAMRRDRGRAGAVLAAVLLSSAAGMVRLSSWTFRRHETFGPCRVRELLGQEIPRFERYSVRRRRHPCRQPRP